MLGVPIVSIGSIGNGRESRRMRTREAAKYIGLGESTLEKDRITGLLKIPFIKAGSAVIYDSRSLDEWMASRQRFSTSDPGTARGT